MKAPIVAVPRPRPWCSSVALVFTPEERGRLRDGLVAAARADERISGAALTGSASLGAEDRWSDIDLALGIAPEVEITAVIADWTAMMCRDHQAVHHTDVIRGATTYRVFLLASTLQVDIAFAPATEFGPTAPTFRLLFGTAADMPLSPLPTAAALIGMGWLYALHARSSIARGRVWQAEYMISGVRDHVLGLACLRHGASPYQGRGMDQLPPAVTAALAGALVRSLDARELRRAFRFVIDALLAEITYADLDLAGRLADTLQELATGTDTR
jgi:hypothetical protein